MTCSSRRRGFRSKFARTTRPVGSTSTNSRRLLNGSRPAPIAARSWAEVVAGMDTFRGADTVKRWLHNVASAHVSGAEVPAAFLDRLVEGRRQRGAVPVGPALDAEISSRLEVLEYLCTIPDNYRCALLLKEGSGLTVERTAFLMGSRSPHCDRSSTAPGVPSTPAGGRQSARGDGLQSRSAQLRRDLSKSQCSPRARVRIFKR
jgi:hypothetical protein